MPRIYQPVRSIPRGQYGPHSSETFRNFVAKTGHLAVSKIYHNVAFGTRDVIMDVQVSVRIIGALLYWD
jgi:hypothetical protein